MADGTSIINIGDLSKPATVLIERITDALGGYFKPFQIKRIAKAKAEADIIRAQAQIKITKLRRRALARFVVEEENKQYNMESITAKAIPQLNTSAAPQDMQADWITNFFDKCRIVSDEEMQSLWARVLAGEANSPGAYSKRTVNFLASLDKAEAQLFTKLCGFAWFINDDLVPLIYDYRESIYEDQGITFTTLTHLDDIGLISFDSIGELAVEKLAQQVLTHYHDISLTIRFPSAENNTLAVGKVIFSKIGEQLASICGAKPIDGFYAYVVKKWTNEGIILPRPSTGE